MPEDYKTFKQREDEYWDSISNEAQQKALEDANFLWLRGYTQAVDALSLAKKIAYQRTGQPQKGNK